MLQSLNERKDRQTDGQRERERVRNGEKVCEKAIEIGRKSDSETVRACDIIQILLTIDDICALTYCTVPAALLAACRVPLEKEKGILLTSTSTVTLLSSRLWERARALDDST